jgi:hypothetical protein
MSCRRLAGGAGLHYRRRDVHHFCGAVDCRADREQILAFRFWTIVTAGRIAAWRIKWEVLFVSVSALMISARMVRISQNRSRFIGLLPAQIGLAGVLTVTLWLPR